MKCMLMYQYPIYDMHFVHRKKNELISEVSFENLYRFNRKHVLQILFFNLVELKAACSPTTCNNNVLHYCI